MKKHITLITLLMLAGLALGQTLRPTKSTSVRHKLDSLVEYELNTTRGEWEAGYRIKFSYDASGHVSTELTESKDESTDLWRMSSRNEYTYDQTGKLTQDIRLEFEDGNEYKTKFAYSYGADENRSREIEYSWLDESNTWSSEDTVVFTYDADGHMLTSGKYLYTYDAEGDISQLVIKEMLYDGLGSFYYDTLAFTYNTSKDTFVYMYNERRYECVCDDQKNLLSKTRYNVDEEGEYQARSKEEYTYDLTTEWSELLLPPWDYKDYLGEEFYMMPIKNRLLKTVYFYWEDDTWKEEYKATLYYDDSFATAMPQLALNATMVYPNPTTDIVYFDLGDCVSELVVDLFDMQCRKVLSAPLDANKLSLGGLESGIYIYHLKSKDGVKSGRIVKR